MMNTLKSTILVAALSSLTGVTFAANYDLLGRKGSQMNSPMVHKGEKNKTIVQKTNQLNSASLARQGLNNVQAISGSFFENNFASDYGDFLYEIYTSNNHRIENASENEYFTAMNENFTSVTSDDPESSDMISVPMTGTKYTVKFLNKVKNTETTSYIDIAKKNGRGTEGYGEVKGKKIGIFFSHDANFVKFSADDNTQFLQTEECYNRPTPYDESNVTSYLEAVKRLSRNLIVPYTHNTLCTSTYPIHPELRKPQLYMGLHTRKATTLNGGKGVNQYTSRAKALDNYIYNNHTVDIVAAGDFGDYMTEEGLAANAITVGALNLGKKEPVIPSYSSYKNTTYGAGKPEIVNYTDFVHADFVTPYQTTYTYVAPVTPRQYPNGDTYVPTVWRTPGAASHTAATVSDLLALKPFYRWHPEVVKAALLSSGEPLAGDRDSDPRTVNVDALLSTDPYKCYGVNNRLSRFWNGSTDAIFKDYDGKKEIRFTIKVRNGNKYKAAIAWLSSGNDIDKLKRIPQDIDLSVYYNDNAITTSSNGMDKYTTNFTRNRSTYIASSNSSGNPYEAISFEAESDTYVTFVIRLYSDNHNSENYGNVKLGFSLHEKDKEGRCVVGF